MASVKLIKFLGEAPKISSELLPDGVAQEAFNVKLYSGDLIPYRTPKLVDATERSQEAKTLHALRNPTTDALVWLSWTTDVDIAVASDSADNAQRFYYSGDGAPKVSDYALATNGSEPYPVTNGYYDLGLPLPDTTVTATAASFSVVSSTHYERDSGNTATFYGNGAHNLRTGNIVTVRDFGTSDEAKSFNAKNVEITVVNSTDFQYFSSGDQVSKTANTTGRSDLAGNTQIRTYLYTFITPWDEESIPSIVSNELYIKEGQIVTVSSLPQSAPSGDNFIRGIRLYRSVASASATDYFLLQTLWFPTNITTVERADNVSIVTLSHPHNFIVGDRFKIKDCTNATFNITGGIVTEVVNDYKFKYAQSATNVGSTAVGAGKVYHDVSELATSTARYWGDSDYDFTDDFLVTGLSTILPSEDYDPPPATMQGLITAHNNILVGFFGNQLCFSFPDKPHAWPEKYRLTFDSDIVAIQAVSGYILVLTEEYPFQVSGNDPATMVSARIDTLYPCYSKRSVLNMGYGVVWATHGGLASWSPTTGIDLITKFVHDWDTWNTALDPTTIVGHYYDGKYFGSHSTGSFIFERDDKVGGYFVQIQYRFSAAYSDPQTGTMYYTLGSSGDIHEWDNENQTLSPMEWKSKTIVTKDYLNLGAARVIADFETSSQETLNIIAYNNGVPVFNTAIWARSQQIGTLNGPTNYISGGITYINNGSINGFTLNGDPQTRYTKLNTGVQPITFKLFVDKQLVFQASVQNDEIFRLPTGYRSDTFEVAVSGSSRVRAIHFGETPFGLRTS
jgi:hypothetical protein|tara:strand:+ start:4118 stop:6490 length:2373 start_codon:yes stop_codon:yes gene_type:complete